MFDKIKQLGKLKQMRDDAMKIQKELAQERIEINENGIKVVVTGDQKILLLEVSGVGDQKVCDIINKAIKKSQEMAAKKLQSMSGGLSGLLGGMGN